MKRRRRIISAALLIVPGLSAGLVWIPTWRAAGLTALFAAGPESVRAWSLKELIAIKEEPAALAGLALALDDPSLSLNIRAAEALFELGPEAATAWPAIAERLKAPDLRLPLKRPYPLRQRATKLAKALPRDQDPKRLRCTLAAALARIGPPAAGAEPSLEDELRRVYKDQRPDNTAVFWQKMMQKLREGPVQPCDDLCRHKVLALGRIGPQPSLANALACHILNGETEKDRATAAYALARIGPEARRCRPFLERLLRRKKRERAKQLARLTRGDEPPEMVSERAMIAFAFWSLGGEAALARRELLRICDDRNSARAELARWALKQMAAARGDP